LPPPARSTILGGMHPRDDYADPDSRRLRLNPWALAILAFVAVYLTGCALLLFFGPGPQVNN
jgi:hypothetical protein